MDEFKLPVAEIFYSIDGEGVRTGLPVIFIRLFGCNLNCSYCDTRYACKADEAAENGIVEFDMMEFDRILYKIKQYEPCKCITLTGGEPLIHKDAARLVRLLRENGYEVNIETNGAVDIRPFIMYQEAFGCDGEYFFTMDWKSISSGESDKMVVDNLSVLKNHDVLKFVVGSTEDLDQMRELLEKNPGLKAQVFVSPIWNQISPRQLVEYVLEHKLTDVRVQVQLHKIIWDPNKRGV
jgi:7-carboxy-7-deazaguanine synthase